MKRLPSPSLAISLLALFIALAGTTWAATGGTFILGQPNTATSQTSLTSNNAGRALSVTQRSTAAGASALGLNVPAGKPPLVVNSGVKVANLNADSLDGADSTAFLRKTGKAADSDKLDGFNSNAFARIAGANFSADAVAGHLDPEQVIGSVDVTPSRSNGGVIKADAIVRVRVTSGSCDLRAGFQIPVTDPGGGSAILGFDAVVRVDAADHAGGEVVTLPLTGATDFGNHLRPRVEVFLNQNGNCTANAAGTVTAVYSPFNGAGS